jgi:uncharacterized OB-fold protein
MQYGTAMARIEKNTKPVVHTCANCGVTVSKSQEFCTDCRADMTEPGYVWNDLNEENQ